MSRRSAVRVALLALPLLAAHTCTASAAQVTIQPSPAEARTFATTNGGWSSAVDYNGLVCIPGVTCPSANPTYQTTGGAGGAGDGYLRDTFGTLLGVLSTTTINWSSPSFVATTADTATLSVDVRPQIASLLAIGSVRLDMTLVDVADGTRTRAIASVPLTAASASFSTVQATVPPGTIVNGRTYRIQLGVALTTSVSAVTSGNVDLDNVVLRLVDLEPPTGLTATFPGSGSPRIDGAVDPAGQLTSVTVDYGLTASYGTTTTAVTVNGSGSQPFTVPLAGLTAGQTYHYRVTAQNADGTVQTNDATFVAPAAPGNSPPVVTGAGNSRNRTVTYDRPGDVTDATVELLDATGRTVLGSYNDADRDGSVAIVLPDADDTYQVRVVRENAQSVTSTSATVPAVLDRVAPATGAVDLRVTPAVSSDTQRNVSFVVPRDVVAASAQVIDGGGADVGAPVAALGGTAVVQLGSAEGDYRVRLTLTDAAGNAATVLSDPVTLDETAPSAGGAPTVTGAGNSRDRSVRFDRDLTTLTATIEALDRTGTVVATATVLIGDSGTIRLPDADGAYTIRVRQADLAGNAATSAGTPVTLDRAAPSAGPAPTVTGASTSRDRDVSFQRDPETTSATIELLDAGNAVIDTVVVPSGSSGSIRLPDTDGSYSVRVRQTDAATNSATSPVAAIVLDRVAPDAGPAPTVRGAGNSRDRTVDFTRDPSASTVAIELLDRDGRAIDTVPVPSGSTGSIRLPDADGSYSVRVRQSDLAGNSATTPETGVALDRVAPDAGPAPTVRGAGNSRDRSVEFTRALGAADVVIELLDRDGRAIDTVPVPSGSSGAIRLPDADGDYVVQVRQTDAAGNSATTPTTAISLDRVAPDAGPAPTVRGADNARNRDVTFTRDPSALTAIIQVLDSNGVVVAQAATRLGETSGIAVLPDLDGEYTIRVEQADAAGNVADSPATAVTLDRAAPDAGPAPTVTGSVTERDRDVTFTRAPDATSVVIEVLDQSRRVVSSVPVAAGGSERIALPDLDGDYVVQVRQTDAAGNSATTPGTSATLDRGAPVPGPAPTVSGAGNSVERTVSFTRDPETTAATILVFDSGGNVVARVAVAGSSAGIALPDLDGDYTVQVRQENRNGIASLTPATTVTLDRVAPDAGPAPTVDDSNPDAVAVGFRRAPDATTVTIEVVDGTGNVVGSFDVPSGDTATIALPSAPGSYGIRVVQSDAAGNSATTGATPATRRAPVVTPPDDRRTPTAPTTPTTPTTPTPPGSGAQPITDPGQFGSLLQQCFGGDVVLTDVTQRGGRVTVSGLTRYAPGTAVTIVDLAGKRVGSARSGSTGAFRAAVTAPRAARARLTAGYRAVVGTRRSPVVRLRRANVVTGVTVRGTTVTISGRVDLTRIGSVTRIRAYGGAGAASCRKSPQLRAIGRTLVNRRTGTYTLRVRAPTGSGRLVLRTRVFGTRIASRSSFVVR